tara:strand:- start:333 stop:854 length:522 start_codon:yes stop_codon:yes gene_type:complete
MKKILTLSALMILFCYSGFAENVNAKNLESAINQIHLRAIFTGIIMAALTMMLVSSRAYQLIDSRIRKQKDVLYRRIIFFMTTILLPILWFYIVCTALVEQARGIVWGFKAGAAGHFRRLLSAYIDGTWMSVLAFIVVFVLASWIFARFLNRWKCWTIFYSNFKVFGIIGKDK